MTGLSNELPEASGDGWVMIPYGEWPHERGLQRFQREHAEEMVGYFKAVWNRIKRAIVGMPIFRGHPDLAAQLERELARESDPAKRAEIESMVARFKELYPDDAVYGHILDMEARDDGLALRLVLSEDGAALVNEEGLTKFSPHWLSKTLGTDGKRTIYAPVYLKSIGLTARPNIAVTSLVNTAPERAAEKPPQNESAMNKLIIALLAALGRPLANEASETEITNALTAALPHAQALASRPEPTALANEQTARTSAEAKITELTTALANERTAVAAAIEAHATTLVDHAIAAGRITEAEKPVWLGRLKRDFTAESAALANEQPKVKTQARTQQLGERKPANAAGDQFTALVNEAMPQHGNNWTAAWNAVKATAKGKALFDQMDAASAAAGSTKA